MRPVYETIHQRKEEREKLIHELQDTSGRTKMLRGLIPICSFWKRIRDDKGYWTQIEAYIWDHTEADFSHGLFPGCIRKLYPDM